MKKIAYLFVLVTLLFIAQDKAQAHYGMIIPSDQMVTKEEKKDIDMDLLFWHPMAGIPMPLDKPAKFGVYNGGENTDLLSTLKSTKTKDNQTWTTTYKVKRPGLYVFNMEPQPYWEPAEDCYIIHYTKVYVTAFGDDEGWDQPIGLKTEIVPLTRPFGLYAGNVFQGTVLLNGKPVPYSEVEIELYNKDDKFEAENDYMVTQVVKADANGVFTYAAPAAGWWGFAALNTSDTQIDHEGQAKNVELGAVLWVKFDDIKRK